MDIEKSLLLLEETFDTIKKINLTNRTYKNIKPLEEEYSTYDEWIVRFLAKGSIHPEDVEEFLDKTKILTL
jgi:patatin-like phospholipase/acyl hydrolase